MSVVAGAPTAEAAQQFCIASEKGSVADVHDLIVPVVARIDALEDRLDAFVVQICQYPFGEQDVGATAFRQALQTAGGVDHRSHAELAQSSGVHVPLLEAAEANKMHADAGHEKISGGQAFMQGATKTGMLILADTDHEKVSGGHATGVLGTADASKIQAESDHEKVPGRQASLRKVQTGTLGASSEASKIQAEIDLTGPEVTKGMEAAASGEPADGPGDPMLSLRIKSGHDLRGAGSKLEARIACLVWLQNERKIDESWRARYATEGRHNSVAENQRCKIVGRRARKIMDKVFDEPACIIAHTTAFEEVHPWTDGLASLMADLERRVMGF